MIKKDYKDVVEEDVTMYESKNTTIQWLLTKEDGARRFAMRRFKILPGGVIGFHSHPEEHEIFVLKGEGTLIDDNANDVPVKEGDVIFIAPFESHGYKNESSDEFVFLCVIPYLS
ncbi:MAG: cupin domain-containing protein [Candidatus Helarchaeota archaeon]